MWDQLTEIVRAIPRALLLAAVLGAMAMSWLGARMARQGVPWGRALGRISTIALVGILLTVVLQLSHIDPRMTYAFPEQGVPDQIISGGETRVPMAQDGHFWVMVSVNGKEEPFLVDTGATLISVSEGLAKEAGLERINGGMPMQMDTANGAAAAYRTTIASLSFGNISARDVDALIAPGLGDTNVIGMNLLRQLDSWRVEGDMLILVPDAAAAAAVPAGEINQ